MRGASKIASFALVWIAACGGEKEKPPVPLPHHFDEQPLRRLGPQQQVIDAKSQYEIAKAEADKAEADYEDTGTQLQVARNDLKQTQIAIDTAITQKQAAQKTGDMNAVNQAQIQERTAEKLKEAAAARVRFLDVYRSYTRRFWWYAQENMYWREAQLEQVKANVAKERGIQPAKTEFGWFPSQVDERGKRTAHARDKVAKDKEAAAAAHATWRKLQDQADKDNGRATTAWDPMAPQAQPPMPSPQVETKTMSNAQTPPPNGEQPPPAPPQQQQ